MKNKPDLDIREELRLAGASDGDVENLAKITIKLRLLHTSHLPKQRRYDRLVSGQKGYAKILSPIAIASVVCLTIAIYSIVVAQVSHPGQVLYGVKKATEKGAVMIDPEYKEEIMLRRVHEVEYLVSNKAPSQTIIQVLEEYSVAAADYMIDDSEDMAVGTPLYKYCQQTLMDAESKATGPVRRAISHVLTML